MVVSGLDRGARRRPSAVGLLGGALLVFAVAQAALDGEPLGEDAIESAAPLLLSVALVSADRWIARQRFDPRDRRLVTLFTLGGAASVLGLALWLIVLQRIEGTPFGEPAIVVLGGTSLGGVAGVIVGVAQARQRRALRTVERQRERLDEFASTVSHDLRNPLNVAQANLLDLEEGGDGEHLDAIRRALDRMERLIEGTLDLARQGQVVSEAAPVALADVAEAAWSAVGTREATLRLDGDLGVVRADEGRLRRLFENLYHNAVTHAGPDVTVRVGRLDAGFFVEDDGPGVPESEREDVWGRGYSTAPESSGLGLAIVRAIAEAHGWEVAMADGEAGGARVTVRSVKSA